MNKNKGVLRHGVELLVFGLLAGALIAGCGGGGSAGGSSSGSGFAPSGTLCGNNGCASPGATGSTSPASSVLASYIADSQGTSFLGNWVPGVVYTNNLSATGFPGTYNIAYGAQVLAGGAWSSATLTASEADLNSTGWAASSLTGNKFVDSGNGTNATENYASGASLQFIVTQTSKAGTPILCATCAAGSGNYPAGASWYTRTFNSSFYSLVIAPLATPATDATGATLTALPAIGTTFCDPYNNLVYQPVVGATGSTPNYTVFITTGCSASAISAALAGVSPGSVFVSLATTPAAGVSVLSLSGWAGGLSGINVTNGNYIYGAYSGNVWSGFLGSPGYTEIVENKIAINAELQASGSPTIP